MDANRGSSSGTDTPNASKALDKYGSRRAAPPPPPRSAPESRDTGIGLPFSSPISFMAATVVAAAVVVVVLVLVIVEIATSAAVSCDEEEGFDEEDGVGGWSSCWDDDDDATRGDPLLDGSSPFLSLFDKDKDDDE